MELLDQRLTALEAEVKTDRAVAKRSTWLMAGFGALLLIVLGFSSWREVRQAAIGEATSFISADAQSAALADLQAIADRRQEAEALMSNLIDLQPLDVFRCPREHSMDGRTNYLWVSFGCDGQMGVIAECRNVGWHSGDTEATTVTHPCSPMTVYVRPSPN